jgi:hypothetical protein
MMAVFMVDRDLPGVTNDQLAAAQTAAIARNALVAGGYSS